MIRDDAWPLTTRQAWRAVGSVRSPARRSSGRRGGSASSCSLPQFLSAEEDTSRSQQGKQRGHEGATCAAAVRGVAAVRRRVAGDEESSPGSDQAPGRSRPARPKRKLDQGREAPGKHSTIQRTQPPTISESSSASSDVECGSVEDSPIRPRHHRVSPSRRASPAPMSYLGKRSADEAGAGSGGKGVSRSKRGRVVQAARRWRGEVGAGKVGSRVCMSSDSDLEHRSRQRHPLRGAKGRAAAVPHGLVPSEESEKEGGRARGRGGIPSVSKYEEIESCSFTSSGNGSLGSGVSSSPERENGYGSWRSTRGRGERGHAEDGSKRHTCREWDCSRRAHFGTPGWVPAHCEEHRRDWEVFLKVRGARYRRPRYRRLSFGGGSGTRGITRSHFGGTRKPRVAQHVGLLLACGIGVECAQGAAERSRAAH